MKKNQTGLKKGQKTAKISKPPKTTKVTTPNIKKSAPKIKQKTKAKKSKTPSSIEQKPEQSSVNQNYYQIESILKRRILKNGTEEFLVSWKGYNSHANRWISRKRIVGLQNLLINEYLEDLEVQNEEKSKKKPIKAGKLKKPTKQKKGIKPGELIILQSDSISENKEVDAKQDDNPQIQSQSYESSEKEQEVIEDQPVVEVKPVKVAQPQLPKQKPKQIEVVVSKPPQQPVPPPVPRSSSVSQNKTNIKKYTKQELQIFHRFYQSQCPCCNNK